MVVACYTTTADVTQSPVCRAGVRDEEARNVARF
jgi:hypothetical protein